MLDVVSTKELIDLEQVKDEVKRYESRWLIEEYFKLLKTDAMTWKIAS